MGIFTDTQRGPAVFRLRIFVPLFAGFACLMAPAARAAQLRCTDTCALAQQPPTVAVPPAGEPRVFAEIMPSFEGGALPDFRKWVCERIEYPADAFRRKAEGRVVCSFVVETDGRVACVEALHSPDSLLAAEVVRVVSSSPRWTPGRQEGQTVRVRLVLPVDFRVQEQCPQDGGQEASDLQDEVPSRFREDNFAAYHQELLSRVRYPGKALNHQAHGQVVCSFVVEPDGSVSSVEVLRSPDPALSEEVVRVLSATPRWAPGLRDGKAVPVRYTLPVDFQLQGPEGQFAPIEGEISYRGEVDREMDLEGEPDAVVSLPEVMPRFKGRFMDAFLPWCKSHLHYPIETLKSGVQGRVVCSFVVDTDGSVTSVEVIQSPDVALSEEVVSTLSASPLWTPARRDGNAVRVRYKLAIVFRPEGAKPSRSAAMKKPRASRGEAPADQSFSYAEVMPRFKGGGLDAFGRWVYTRLRYPDEALKKRVEGRVECTFVIDTDGSVTSVQVLDSPHPALSEEVVRLLSASPRWKPGMQKGKAVKVRFNWGVRFGIEGWEPDVAATAIEERQATAEKLLRPQIDPPRLWQ